MHNNEGGVISKKDILIILCLFSIAFLIRVFGVSNVVIVWDEWLYWTRAFEILANNWIPTAKVFSGPSPFFPYLEAMVTLLFDGDLNTLRMISVIFGSLTVPFLYLFGKAMYNRKTGLLSALFLCFSAYHAVYSRIIMYEAFTLFFVTAFLYFFWLSWNYENDRKSTTYTIIAGALMGLAIAVKYLPAFLVPAIFIYILWTKRSFKALINKKIILMLIFAFLFLMPLLIGLISTGQNPINFYIIDILKKKEVQTQRGINMFEQGAGGGQVLGINIPPELFFLRGLEKITEILSWGTNLLNPNWSSIFQLSVILLFLITIFFYLHGFIKREERSSFLFISICVLFIIILLLTTATKYYLIYSFPFYFVMLSHLTIESFAKLRKEHNWKNIFNIMVVSLTTIMLFSYFITGATSPSWEVGEELSWVKSAGEFIKNDITKSGYTGNVLIGSAAGIPAKINYIFDDVFNNINNITIKTFRMGKPGSQYRERLIVDVGKIDTLQPSYLIASEIQYNNLFKDEAKQEILKDYLIVFHSQSYYLYNGYVLKRINKTTRPREPILLSNPGGNIYPDIFKKSLPRVMEVGNAYTVLIKVKNTGNFRRTFTVELHSEGDLIFIQDSFRKITMDEGSTQLLKFKIVPIKEHAGKIPIDAYLYIESEKVDSVSDDAFLIEK